MEDSESKLTRALRLVDSGRTAYQAAKEVGMSVSGVYTAVNRRKLRALAQVQPCPCCGRLAARADMDLSALSESGTAKLV